MTFLNRMTPGQRGRVVGFTNDSPITRRLLELGLVPGRSVFYLRDAPLRDPMEIMIGLTCLSLRHAEAALVTMEVEDQSVTEADEQPDSGFQRSRHRRQNRRHMR
ncbi:MAG TPA: FeoA domain-containing protein [Candidatus Deferrimicrobium sp.]|nr:FeoA domain-containing protein [Candidatus Deferrimicrobium sp.]